MGNPHYIIVIDNIMDFPVSNAGRCLGNHRIFPKDNVEFMNVEFLREIKMSMGKEAPERQWHAAQGHLLLCCCLRLKGLYEKCYEYITGVTY